MTARAIQPFPGTWLVRWATSGIATLIGVCVGVGAMAAVFPDGQDGNIHLYFVGLGFPSALAWFFLVSPLAIWLRHDVRIFHPRIAPIFGASGGLLIFGAISLMMFPGNVDVDFDWMVMALIPCTVGAVTWSSYALAARRILTPIFSEPAS